VCRVLARSGPNPAAASAAPALTTSHRDCKYFGASNSRFFRQPACSLGPENADQRPNFDSRSHVGRPCQVQNNHILSGNPPFAPGPTEFRSLRGSAANFGARNRGWPFARGAFAGAIPQQRECKLHTPMMCVDVTPAK
jgi:hypothetical protein